MKTTTKMPILTRRDMLLKTYGPGPRLCLDGAANWLGCDARCEQSCILGAGHQLDKEEIARRRAELLASREQQRQDERAASHLRAEKHRQMMRARKAIARKPQTLTRHEGELLHDALAEMPMPELLPLSVLCAVCQVAMHPRGNKLVCPRCGGWKAAS